MPCCNVTINENYKFDKTCMCIPTNGKSCICVCENENGDFVKCNDCVCVHDCQCQCGSKCKCIVTNGACCICVCRDEEGNIKTCDCCTNPDMSCCKDCSVKTCQCIQKVDIKPYARNCRFDGKTKKPDCTNLIRGNSCPCVCKDEKVEKCSDDCKCTSGNCQIKSNCKCTCIYTKRACCTCVGGIEEGVIKTCDCCTVTDIAKSCCKDGSAKTCQRSQKIEKKTCGKNCGCCGKVNKMPACCLPTGDKKCACTCENNKDAIVCCDDCKRVSANSQCKCNSKCICIDTKEASCICECCGKTQISLKARNCCCTNVDETKSCCEKGDYSKMTCKCCQKDDKVCYEEGCKCCKQSYSVSQIEPACQCCNKNDNIKKTEKPQGARKIQFSSENYPCPNLKVTQAGAFKTCCCVSTQTKCICGNQEVCCNNQRDKINCACVKDSCCCQLAKDANPRNKTVNRNSNACLCCCNDCTNCNNY